MPNPKQSEADLTSSRPQPWSESVIARDTAESLTLDTPIEKAQQVSRSRLLNAPTEIRSGILKRPLDKRSPQIVDTLKVDQNRSSSLALFGKSPQVRRETFFHPPRDVQDLQNSHRYVINFTLEEIRVRCTSPRHLQRYLDREVSNLAIPLVKELEIYIKMPSPHCRAGKEISFRIIWMEDTKKVEFEILGQRQDPNGNGKNVPGDVPYTLEHLESCADAFAQSFTLTRYGRRREISLSVRACVVFVHDFFSRNCCFQELLRLSESTNGGMAGSREQSLCQTASMLLPFWDGLSTEKQTHLAGNQTEETYLAMATQSTKPSNPEAEVAGSGVPRGRQSLNTRTQNDGRRWSVIYAEGKEVTHEEQYLSQTQPCQQREPHGT